jgi:hypothetical protein
LHGKTVGEVDQMIKSRSDVVKVYSDKRYTTYEFEDGSRIDIRNDQGETTVQHGRVTRTPAPRYNANGDQINKGWRYKVGEGEIRTRNSDGSQIPNAHDSNEFVNF